MIDGWRNTKRFKSTPGISAGRTRYCQPQSNPCKTFQSTPGISAGRTCRRPPSSDGRHWVSIHTRHFCRANLLEVAVGLLSSLVSIHTRHFCRANLADLPTICTKDAVSIHTRHFCRANLVTAGPRLQTPRFQSTPGISAGRTCRICYSRPAVTSFNPHPAFLPGEPDCVPRQRRVANCFNPHPAFLPGEPRRAERWWCCCRVSIHTRHFCRANQMPQSAQEQMWQFQSTPGISAGRTQTQH